MLQGLRWSQNELNTNIHDNIKHTAIMATTGPMKAQMVPSLVESQQL